jgi:large subunit ribosomal protein L10
MPNEKKMAAVEELKEKFGRCTIAIATNYSGLPVNTMTDLRQKMREKNIEYRVIKNTITYLAADSAGRPQIKDIVQGPTALAFGYGEPIEVAKALEEYIRLNRSSLTIRGAVLNGDTLSAEQVVTMSRLPPRPELVGQLLGQIQAPLATFIGQLQTPMMELLGVLNGPMASITNLLQQRAEQLTSQTG